ncbi:T9SS sorting signal type C domain-containing protein [Flavobacterium sp. WC2429]|uniref:T9SS sorting signal type C domain-containing protein n=1 Tax=Flavobacterium sp. WC2429 TaxID=3234140 RepID=A0AB39WNR3_9FLAO
MIKKILLPFLLVLVHTAVFAITKTYTATSGTWNNAANWSPSGVPTSSDDVVIPAGKTVTISANTSVKSVSVSGALTINNGIVFTVGSDALSGSFTVNSGGSFTMGSGNDLATLIVYGTYSNNGITDFWKSTVIITGDLLSSSTSELQKQGNVIVGGNIIGLFDTTGGNGSGQIYAVNPNATVDITPASIDSNVIAGTQVVTPTETQTLVDLVNSIIYSGSCSNTVNGTSNVTTCVGNTISFNVSTTGTASGFQWEVNNGSGWATLSNGGSYSGVATSTLTISNVTILMSSYKFRAKVIVSSCTKNSNYGVLTVNTLPSTPTIIAGGSTTLCTGGSVTLTSSVGTSYLWSTGATTQSISVTTSGNYKVQVTNTSGCQSASSVATSVIVNALPNNITNGFSATIICTGGSPQLTYDADDTTFTTPYNVTYKNDTTLQQYTVSILSAAPFSFTPADNPTTNNTYTLVSISNASCTNSVVSSFLDSGASLVVRPMAAATIAGTTSVCAGTTSPNITFTNSRTVAVTVTYNINGGSNQTVDISASASTNVAVATSTAGTFVYNLVSANYQSTPSCSNIISGSATVTVNSNLAASVSIAASPLGAICSGTLVNFTATPINGGANPTYQWYNGATIISGATSSTYTSSTIANGDAIKVVMTSNATCATASPATSNTITMTVNPNSPASVSIATSPLGAICSGTSVTFTAIPINGGTTPTYKWYNGVTLISGATSSIYTSSTLSNGDAIKVIMTSNAACATGSPVSSNIVTITVPAAAVWNGAWTNGPPTSAQAVVFNGTYNIAGDMEACSCQVNSGAVTVNSGITLKIINGVTVAGGSLTFENTASLVQINSINNVGNITFRRLTSPISNLDYTYWSSPVSPQTLFNVSPNTLSDKFYSFNGSTDSWVQESPSKTMDKGIGYIIRGPQNYVAPNPPGLYQASFVGVPNNGSVQIPITTSVESSYLLGNPYPSALDADTFIKNNPILDGTLYFWTHNTNIGTNVSSPGSGVYAYSGDDYASYNLTGGAGTGAGLAAGSSTNLGSFNATIPSGKIGSGQGFFVTTTTSGTITFANTMRVGVGAITGNNSEFFKFQSSKSTEIVEKSRVWLNLFSTEGIFKQLLVGYITGATNDIDSSYDGDSFDGNEYLDFYSINNDRKLVIQGRSLPFDNNDKVPLGYRSEIEGSFTIAIDQVDGFFDYENVFIEDRLLNIVHDLKESSYSFNTDKGTFDDRFVLSYTNKTLSTDRFIPVEKGVLISNKNKEIKISSSIENIDTVLIYDLLGRQIYKKTNINSKELIVLNTLSAKQTLLIKVNLEGGEVINKKIIY